MADGVQGPRLHKRETTMSTESPAVISELVRQTLLGDSHASDPIGIVPASRGSVVRCV